MKMIISFLSLFLLFASCESSGQQAKVQGVVSPTEAVEDQQARKNLEPEEFQKALAADENAILIDVRTAQEFATGFIPGAINLDVRSSDFKTKLQELDPSKDYYVNCKSGIRSSKACSIMESMGFEGLTNLKGGILAWEKAGKSIEK